MPETFTLPRTGNRQLQFEGEELASADSSVRGGNDSTRHHELALYRTIGGKYVIAIGYRTRWQGEHNHDAAIVCDSPEEATETLRSTLPTEHLMGFPPGDHYAEKRARVERDLCLRFEKAASTVLRVLGPEKLR